MNEVRGLRYPRVYIILLILTPLVLSISLSMDIYVPSLPMLMNYFHTSQQAIQWTLSIYMFGVGIGQLFLGPISDWLGRRKVVLAGITLYLFGTFTCIVAKSIEMLVVGRLLQSIGTCAALTVAFAVVRDIYDTRTCAKVYSYLNALSALGPVVAPMLGGYLDVHYGTWRAPFIFLFLFAVVSFITTFFFLPETYPPEKRVGIQFRELTQRFRLILFTPSFIRNSYISSVGLTLLFAFCCISSYLLIKRLHVTELQYGMVFGSNAVTFITANLVSTVLTRHFPLQVSIKAGIYTLIFGSIYMILVNVFAGLSVLHFMLPMWFATFGVGLFIGPSTALALENFQRVAGTASSLISSFQFIMAGIFGTILMMHTVSSATPFAVLMLVLGVIAWVWQVVDKSV